MQKKIQNVSSLYLSENDKKSLEVLQENRKKIKKPHYKVQIINQNLQQAIKQVRSNVKQNPQWHLNVKAVSSQYKPINQKPSIINESLRKQQTSYKQYQLPKSKNLVFPTNIEINRMNKNEQLQKMKYTERQKKQFQNRIREIKEKRMQIQVSLLEKQMKAKLQRKIQQNLKLKQKRQLIKEIQQKRDQSLKLKDVSTIMKRQQESLLHESNIANVKMLRKYRSRSHKKQLNQHRSLSQESSIQLKFKQMEQDRMKYQKKEILLTRYKNLRSSSQQSLQKRIQTRVIGTSNSTRKVLLIN